MEKKITEFWTTLYVEFNNRLYQTRKACERHTVYVGTDTLFDGLDGPFNFTDVVVVGRDVDTDGKKIVFQALELDVGKNDDYVKTTFLIQVEDSADAVEDASLVFYSRGSTVRN